MPDAIAIESYLLAVGVDCTMRYDSSGCEIDVADADEVHLIRIERALSNSISAESDLASELLEYLEDEHETATHDTCHTCKLIKRAHELLD